MSIFLKYKLTEYALKFFRGKDIDTGVPTPPLHDSSPLPQPIGSEGTTTSKPDSLATPSTGNEETKPTQIDSTSPPSTENKFRIPDISGSEPQQSIQAPDESSEIAARARQVAAESRARQDAESTAPQPHSESQTSSGSSEMKG